MWIKLWERILSSMPANAAGIEEFSISIPVASKKANCKVWVKMRGKNIQATKKAPDESGAFRNKWRRDRDSNPG